MWWTEAKEFLSTFCPRFVPLFSRGGKQMVDKDVLKLAQHRIQLKISEQRQHLQKEIERVRMEMSLAGITGGMALSRIANVCSESVKVTAELVWRTLSECITKAGVDYSDELTQELKEVVDSYLPEKPGYINNILVQDAQTRGLPELVSHFEEQVDQTRARSLARICNEIELFVLNKKQESTMAQRTMSDSSKYIFLGHGRSLLWTLVQRHLEHNLSLLVEVWENESRAGRTPDDVVKEMLDKSEFAVIVVTGDDKFGEDQVRARQNVIHEIGMTHSRFGYEKVALLVQEGVELPSNFSAITQIRFNGEDVRATFADLEDMLRREGILGSFVQVNNRSEDRERNKLIGLLRQLRGDAIRASQPIDRKFCQPTDWPSVNSILDQIQDLQMVSSEIYQQLLPCREKIEGIQQYYEDTRRERSFPRPRFELGQHLKEIARIADEELDRLTSTR
jgi:predicted nucleotide-binding protein